MSQNTWILVAHRAGARLYSSAGPDHGLHLVERIDHPEGRLRNRALNADSGGRTFDRQGEHRHAMESEHSPVEHVTDRFVKTLADRLRDGRIANRYTQLVLVAGPKLLGKLRDALDEPTATKVVQSLDRDLGDLSVAALERHIKDALAL